MAKSENTRKNPLKGGIGDKAKASDFDPEQIKKGLKTEGEHTPNKSIAMDIVLDHLTEDPHYYDKLATIESIKRPTKKEIVINIVNEINSWLNEQVVTITELVKGELTPDPVGPGKDQFKYGDCETCGGSGYAYQDPLYEEKCWSCEGSGFKEKSLPDGEQKHEE